MRKAEGILSAQWGWWALACAPWSGSDTPRRLISSVTRGSPQPVSPTLPGGAHGPLHAVCGPSPDVGSVLQSS